jgi:transcriptional regulator with XRE-family HTH domain
LAFFATFVLIDFRLASNDHILAEIGSRLRAQRLVRIWTQQELAERAGVALSAVKKVEAGGNATLRTIVKVAQALSIAQDLSAVFAPAAVTTIAEMERAAAAPRQRARRPVSPVASSPADTAAARRGAPAVEGNADRSPDRGRS